MTALEFYANYTKATSSTDAYYRSLHGFMSGDISKQNQEPTIAHYQPMQGEKYVRNTSALYSSDGNTYYIVDGYGNVVNEIYKGAQNKDFIRKPSVSELEKLIIDNPSILRRPIIVEDNKLQVGYNEEDIRVFIPAELRKILMTLDCDACDYKDALKKYYYDQVNN